VTRSALVLWAFLAATALAAEPPQAQFEIGGPLAGLRLPLFPTQQGERPGHPGDLPGRFDGDLLAPIYELCPGSVELWRNYWFKYCPVRSFFDRQSRLRNWLAPNIPGADPARAEQYAAPLYHVPRHADVVNTGLRWRPVPVVRCRVGAPVIRLDLGDLDAGVYAIRLIAAVDTAQLRPFRLPLYIKVKINDGPNGEENSYRLRLGYCDELYSIAEVYFHSDAKRPYRAEVSVDAGSQVDLLLHEVSLDDVLAGTVRRAVKTRKTLVAEGRPAPPKPGLTLDPEERLRRDASIWNGFPHDNAQGFGHGWMGGDEHTLRKNVAIGVPGKSAKDIAEEAGAWTPGKADVLLANKKLGLSYTMDDLRRGLPLPPPYPYSDDGAGLFFPDPKDPGKGSIWSPIADEVQNRIREYPGTLVRSNVARYMKEGDLSAARDAAVALARFAYAFPTLDASNFLLYATRDPGPYGRDIRCRRRDTTANFYSHYMSYVDPILYDYDRLFDFMKDNQDLAASVGRFVPWVKTPQDLTKLIDVYLVQTTAKHILRYHYHTDPTDIANAAAVLGDTAVTDPWMEWLFSRTFIYPLPPVGIADAMITGCCRDGCQYIGSTYYAQGEGGSGVAASLDRYLRSGGNPRFNLSDRARYPKPVAHCFWRLRNVVAGWDFLRIGDVCGPDKPPGHTLRDLDFALLGWQWTADPRFAFILFHYIGRHAESDEEWAKIEQAAAQVPRAPWLDNRSRVLPMWAGILETGHQHDDPRFRRAAYVRVGFGVGHEHNDTLDLHVTAQGIPATIDGGQRGGYSSPGDATTRVHNVVEVDGQGYRGYSWVRALADAPGARYLMAEAEPPANTTLFRRQVALIDVDEGEGSKPLPIPLQKPFSKLPTGVIPANSYIFDVFRVAGGKTHTYCFHGTVEDQFEWNVADTKPLAPDDATEVGQYLAMFKSLPDKRFFGTAPATLEAVWRQTRDPKTPGNEAMHLGANFDPAAPRHFTKLHLLGVEGARAMRGSLNCFQWKYDFANVFVQKVAKGESQDTTFVALIEPFIGAPFITERRLLEVQVGAMNGTPKNLANAAYKAVAVEVKTANGRRDLCFADGIPGLQRIISEAKMTVAGEFAYLSTDTTGLRQATLAGGNYLEAPGIKIVAAARERTGKVVSVDYLNKCLLILPGIGWPSHPLNRLFEIGVPGHWTSYAMTEATLGGFSVKLSVENGADYFRSPIEEVKPEEGIVRCVLNPTMGNRPGINKSWVASDDEMKTFWRADLVADKTFKLTGAPVTREAFGPAGVLRLWEYGVGDSVRQSTFVSLRRTAPGEFELVADVDVELTLAGQTRKIATADMEKGQGRLVIKR